MDTTKIVWKLPSSAGALKSGPQDIILILSDEWTGGGIKDRGFFKGRITALKIPWLSSLHHCLVVVGGGGGTPTYL